MEETQKIEVAWSNIEVCAVNIAIVIVAFRNKLIAEGMEESETWELTIELAKQIYQTMFPFRSWGT